MGHYKHLGVYTPGTREERKSGSYVPILTKFQLPTTAAAGRATRALEEFVAAIKLARELPSTATATNGAIEELGNIIKPPTRTPSNTAGASRVNGAVTPRVGALNDVATPRVRRSLRLQKQHVQKGMGWKTLQRDCQWF